MAEKWGEYCPSCLWKNQHEDGNPCSLCVYTDKDPSKFIRMDEKKSTGYWCENCRYNEMSTSQFPCNSCEWDMLSNSKPSEWAEKAIQPNQIIKDSGERMQFASGAVRDTQEGKGRCDLLPMCVLLRLAKHYEAGAVKYSERNWEKGIPAHSFADSALRHIFKYMDGQRDEDHLIAAIWNLCGLAWTEEKRPECMDIPARKEA